MVSKPIWMPVKLPWGIDLHQYGANDTFLAMQNKKNIIFIEKATT
jgi:hypothetical protein